ncbi:hypothetical protein IKF33_02660 [Candidatus Saccharibacteria bacterium]|nr:hypothetical protein [Candidatus Saccharibacteria bacterium]
MKVVCVWRDNTDYAREVTEWLEEFAKRDAGEIESLDPDTIEGEAFARAHDVVEYPTIIAVDDEGRELEVWRGLPLPLMDQVAYYAKES